jgi:membrane protein implicated in regulation of membrane protease activity
VSTTTISPPGTAPAEAPPTGPPTGAARRPLGDVIASVVDGAKTLARQRVELAKLEATEAAVVRAKGGGMFAGAAVLGLFAFGFIAAAGAAALATVLPVWAAILIIGALLLVIAAILAAVGRRVMKRAPKPGERTKQTLKEDARWAKQQIES